MHSLPGAAADALTTAGSLAAASAAAHAAVSASSSVTTLATTTASAAADWRLPLRCSHLPHRQGYPQLGRAHVQPERAHLGVPGGRLQRRTPVSGRDLL